MKNIHMIYQHKKTFEDFLTANVFDLNTTCLVRIYTAECTKDQAVCIAKEIKEVLPNAKIIGGSGSGIIFEGKQCEDETLVIIESFENARIAINTYSFLEKTAEEIVQEMTEDMGGGFISLMHLLCGDHYFDIHNFVEEFNRLNPLVRLAGGVTGDILSKNIVGYVFTENGVKENGIITAAIYGIDIQAFSAINISHTPISTCYRVDKCDGSLILEIENRLGVDWCQEQFGIESLIEYTDWGFIAENDSLIRFPLILEGHGGASRFIKYDTNTKKISLYFSQLNNSTKFRIGYTSPIACAQQCYDICNNMMETPIESLFCYTCLFRKLYLGNCAEWELRPFLSADICGVFMMGEIGLINGRNEFLNGSCSFIGVADEEVYIKPDFNVFDDLYKIRDDNQQLANYVLQKQSTVMSKENEELIQKVLERQEKETEMLYSDINTGIANSLKYAQDNQNYQFDKMCMVYVENYDLLMAVLGQDEYHALLRRISMEIREYTKATFKDKVFYYILSGNTLFMAANGALSDADFIQITNDYYDRYKTIKSDQGDDLLLNRFVLILHQKDLLASGLNTLEKCRNLQTRFLISDDSMVGSPGLGHEMKMINILNYVIEQKQVIPYFQGIYDNSTKQINKYEALMRIQDAEGKIYAPGAFMEIAKKYHMYGALSKLMVDEVFRMFAGKKENVAINLSASDINSYEMQDFIFSRLMELEDASNFVIEIVEDENLKNMDKLKPFIEKIRSFGVKIAIDDFGSGYSNFIEILMLEPDYIKIDISIVRNIDINIINQKVLENISFLGKQLNAKLVAEGVENKEVQEKIENMEVQFSQGFLFARPTPFQDLGLELDEQSKK